MCVNHPLHGRKRILKSLGVLENRIVEHRLNASHIVVVYLAFLLGITQLPNICAHALSCLVWFNPHVLLLVVSWVFTPILWYLRISWLWQLCALDDVVSVGNCGGLALYILLCG